MGEGNQEFSNSVELISDNEEEVSFRYWTTLYDFENIWPKLFRYFISKWNILVLWIISILIIIFEIIFHFTSESYRNRPVNLWVAIITPLIIASLISISILIVQNFKNKTFEKRNLIINKLKIKTKIRTIKVKNFKQRKITNTINFIFLGVILLVLGGIPLVRLIIRGPGFYNPNTAIGYFMASIKICLNILCSCTIQIIVMILSSCIGVISAFPKDLDQEKLYLKPTKYDRSGGFKPIGQFMLWHFIVLILIYSIHQIINGIEVIIQVLITEPLTVVTKDTLITSNFTEKFIPFLLIIFATFMVSIYILITLTSYKNLIKNYKEKKLKPLLEKKHKIIENSITDETKIKLTNANLTELNKLDYLINELNSVSNWIISFRGVIAILGSGLLPAIITVIFKVIEIFVLK